MRTTTRRTHDLVSLCLVAALAPLICNSATADPSADDWPAFRGNSASVAQSATLPLSWSVESGENIAWTADLPGRGVSSPIVVDGRVIVTAASGPREDRLHVLAFDQKTGEKLWQRNFWATGRTLFHPLSSVAANTPASDGQRVFAVFSSNDVFALDLNGDIAWIRGLNLQHPLAGNDVGMGSSPAVVDGAVIVQSEAQGASFAMALDAESGATRWEVDRPRRASWCSPIAVPYQRDGQTIAAAVLQSGGRVDIHRADTGEKLWGAELGCEAMSSPVFDGRLFLPAGGILAFQLQDENGAPRNVWRETRARSTSASPVIYREKAYVINRAGVLSCQPIEGPGAWKLRLGGQFWATPIAAGNHLYCINQDGKAYVVELGEKGSVAGESEFGVQVLGSPAVSGDALFVRSHGSLWKIAKTEQLAATRQSDRRDDRLR
ncbi:PQQ-binding-like beta-propeller repeat protein [Pirellulales bacterium]|nr:PQQ-binding-like beta-propeller repeat protein [Pirellulales bacterium]